MWPFSKRKVQLPSSPVPERSGEGRKMPLSPELADYFSAVANGAYSELWDVEVNLLDRLQSARWTHDFSFHPIVQAFDGMVLDDPNTSNHHIYLHHAVLKGCVLFLSHEGEARIVYATLAEFLSAADAAKRENRCLGELHPPCSPIVENQGALSELLSSLFEDGDTDNEAAVLALIASMDLRDEVLLRRLAMADNFVFGEALAIEIEKRPTAGLLQIAELCTRHGHAQVRDAGHGALAAIGQLSTAK